MNTIVALWAAAALSAWLAGVYSYHKMLEITPLEKRAKIFWDLGFWRYKRVAENLTEPARVHLRRMRVAGLAFAAFVAIPVVAIFVIALLGWLFAAAVAR